jgi:hypothetical protein
MVAEKSKPFAPSIDGIGVVAVVDALGFKGIWKRDPPLAPRDVIGALKRIREEAVSSTWFHSFVGPMQLAAFSDTTIIASQPTERSLTESANWVAFTVASLCAAAASGPVALPYRGAISVGQITVEGEYFVGEAIDEAATWHQSADAALTWFTPTAIARGALTPSLYLMEWAVPLKGSGSVSVLVANPLWIYEVATEAFDGQEVTRHLDDLITRLLSAFGPSTDVDVVRKRQNTERFLAYAKAETLRLIPIAYEEYQQTKRDDEEES